MSNSLEQGAPVLELDGLSVKLGRRTILDDLEASFSGRAIGLLGPNGAGKTTLLRTLLGFYPPTAGGARVFGRELSSSAKEIRAEIGYMPESDAYIANITAVHFVRLMAELSGLPADAALERSHEALFYVGLGEARYRKVGTFSTGMKQMVKLAQALVHGPGLLMLDEPTNGLDPPARKRMIDLVCDIRDRGTSRIILSSHLLGDVETVCDEVLILKNGKIADSCDLEADRRPTRTSSKSISRPPTTEFDSAVAALGLRDRVARTRNDSSWSCRPRCRPANCGLRPIRPVSASAVSISNATRSRTSSCGPWRTTDHGCL